MTWLAPKVRIPDPRPRARNAGPWGGQAPCGAGAAPRRHRRSTARRRRPTLVLPRGPRRLGRHPRRLTHGGCQGQTAAPAQVEAEEPRQGTAKLSWWGSEAPHLFAAHVGVAARRRPARRARRVARCRWAHRLAAPRHPRHNGVCAFRGWGARGRPWPCAAVGASCPCPPSLRQRGTPGGTRLTAPPCL